MFLSISTETGVKEINVYELQTYKSIDDESGKYIYYIMCNGITFSEYFDTDADREAKLEEIGNLNPGGGGGGDVPANMVTTNTAQTISGKKTFSTLPESSQSPTNATDLVNKNYVDAAVSSGLIVIDDNSSSNPFVLEGKSKGTYLFVPSIGSNNSVYIKRKNSDTRNYNKTLFGGILNVVKDVDGTEEQGTKLAVFINAKNLETMALNVYTSASSSPSSGLSEQVINYEPEANYILKVYDQTLSNKLTFNTLPESNVAPTTNNQLVNKKYADDLVRPGRVLGDYTDFNTQENAINIDNLEPGLYFISVKNDNRAGSTRFYIKYTYGGQVSSTQIVPPGSLTSFYVIGDYIPLLIEQKLQSGDFVLGRVKYLCQDSTNKNIATGTISIRIYNGSLTQSGSYEDYAMVLRSGAQTIRGVKTFDTLPESSITPTTNNQLVNKKYVDDVAPLLLPPTLLFLDTSFTSEQIVEALGGQDLLDELLDAVDAGNRAVFGAGESYTVYGLQKAITPITVISQVDDSLGVRYLLLEGVMKGAWDKPRMLRYTLVQTLATSEWSCTEASLVAVSDFDPTLVSGYDETKTQVLKNINGTLSWVDE